MLRTIMKNLPAFVVFEGCTFQLVLLLTENKTWQLTYILTDVRIDSKHYNMYQGSGMWFDPFHATRSKALIIIGNITDEMSARLAASEIKKFLSKYLAKSLAEQKEIVP